MKDLLKVILFFSTPFIGCYLVSILEKATINIPVWILTIIAAVFIGMFINKIMKFEESLKND